MTKKELVKLIREVVKIEVKSAVNSELNEALNILEQKENKVNKVSTTKAPKNYTSNISLNEALNDTKASSEFEAYPEVSVSELRNKFSSMQSGPMASAPMVDHNNMPVRSSTLEKDGLGKALTRDYSELVKRF